jgi:hypothetical protein
MSSPKELHEDLIVLDGFDQDDVIFGETRSAVQCHTLE